MMFSAAARHEPESRYAWFRLFCCLLLGSVVCVSTWSVVVVIPVVEAEFGTLRAGASFPYTMMMFGFAAGTLLMGRLADRAGMVWPIIIGGMAQCAGYGLAGLSQNLMQFSAVHFILGFGGAAGFAPLLSDISHWFTRNRGLAVVIAASGSYVAGVIWPPLIQWSLGSHGWRMAHIAIGFTSLLVSLALSPVFRPRPAAHTIAAADEAQKTARAGARLSPRMVQMLLTLAGFACCVAMAMPQVHIVAYCGDMGYGTARGVEMLSLMLGLGIVSRIASGYVADRIGGIATLLIGSFMQGVALFLYFLFDGLSSLYLISAIFGLFQGGIVPMYAVIIRTFLPPREAGLRIGVVMMATMFGMAAGGYLSGLIFDLTGSYRAAFLHGLVWNFVNLSLILWLMLRTRNGLARPPKTGHP